MPALTDRLLVFLALVVVVVCYTVLVLYDTAARPLDVLEFAIAGLAGGLAGVSISTRR